MKGLRRSIALVIVIFAALPLMAAGAPVRNWTPAVNSDIGHTSPFQAITPCRLVDTRPTSGFPSPYGGPKFVAGETRTYNIPAAFAAMGCGGTLPVAEAYSLNFTITEYVGGGFVTAWPNDGSLRPNVSTVNPGNGAAVANAAIVPASSGALRVYSWGPTHIIIDINGYYTNEQPAGKQLMVTANYPGMAAIYGHNDSNTSGSHGVGGYADGTGIVHGVQGGTAGYGGASGVHGYTAAHSDTYGVFGEGYGDVVNYGVFAWHPYHTLDSAGLLAVAGNRVSVPTGVQEAAIRAEADSGDGIVAYINTGGVVAISGGVYNTATPPVQTLRGSLAWAAGNYAVYGWGDYGGTGAKYFVEPHPTDASKVIRFVALEGNQPTTFFRGRARFTAGQAVITVPEEFRYVTEEGSLTVNITPIGQIASVGVTSMSLDQVTVESTRDVEFSYIVYGVRRGYTNFTPIVTSPDFVPTGAEERIPAYLNDSQKERLIANGTYNPDGTVNISTAIRLGWEKGWRQPSAVDPK